MMEQSQEYRNQHAHRRYPFLDDASLVATAGAALPVDFFIDAILYPINLAGALYLSQIDMGAGTLQFSDSATGKVCATGTWSGNTPFVDVTLYDVTPYARHVGTVVLGPGRTTFSAGGVFNFTAAAASLTPTAYIAVNQQAVRGIVMSDGDMVTGAVSLVGGPGVEVLSYVDDSGRSVIRIDARGTREEDEIEQCKPCGVLRGIKIINNSGALVVGSSAAPNVLAVTTVGFDLTDLCQKPTTLPSRRPEPCDTPVPCERTFPGFAGGSPARYITPVNGHILFTTPNAGETYKNPLWVESWTEPAPPPNADIVRKAGGGLEAKTKLLEHLFDAVNLSRGVIKVEFRNTMAYNNPGKRAGAGGRTQ